MKLGRFVLPAMLVAATFGASPNPITPTEGPSPSGAAATPASTGLSANALYDAAYDRWRALPQAPYVTYEASFLALSHDKVRERRYRVDYRASDRKCLVTGVPIDAQDRVDAPQVTDRCFGPDFAFTFVRQTGAGGGPIPLDIPTAVPSAEPSGEPRVIESVKTRSRPYAVSYAGSEEIDGIHAMHLTLAPYRDASHNILRDLWIDPSDDAVVRLSGEASFALARVTFTVDYATRDGAGERIERLLGYGKAQLLLAKIGADFHYEQTHYAFPAQIPDATFDPNAKHETATAAPLVMPTASSLPNR